MSQLPAVQLPAHLAQLQANTALMGLNSAAVSGIQSGAFPQISIKASRFRLQNPGQEELVVPTLHLDVIIVDANPNGMQKIYYAKEYDPADVEGAAPDCYSDNGVGPSNKASSPQCGTCAACPHNVWGSKISKVSGKPTRACTDVKKVAVFIADNTQGPVFLLRIPPASLKNLVTYIDALSKHGIPAASVITRLTFDPNASHPLIQFAPAMQYDAQNNPLMPYINAEQAEDVMSVIGTPEVDQCTGKNDVPIDPANFKPRAAIAAPAALVAAANPPMPPAPAIAGMPPIGQQVAAQPSPASFQLMTPIGQHVAAQNADAAASPAPEAAKPKRTRKAPAAAATAALASVSPSVPATASFAPGSPPRPPGGGVPTASLPPAPPASPPAGTQHAPIAPAVVSNSALDEMIKKAMNV